MIAWSDLTDELRNVVLDRLHQSQREKQREGNARKIASAAQLNEASAFEAAIAMLEADR